MADTYGELHLQASLLHAQMVRERVSGRFRIHGVLHAGSQHLGTMLVHIELKQAPLFVRMNFGK
jgi:hypothetical protein